MKTNRLHRVTLASMAALGLAALGLTVLAQSADAQPTSAQQNAIRQHCRTDFKALCSRVKPGGSEALACLAEHAERLSPACQDAVYATMPPEPATPVANAAAKPPAAQQPQPVTSRHIVSAPPPAARTPNRAVKHAAATTAAADPVEVDLPPQANGPKAAKHPQSAKLTPAAKATAEPKPQNAAHAPAESASAMFRACHTDLARHCRNVRPGGNRELACLAAHRNTISARCYSALRVSSRTR